MHKPKVYVEYCLYGIFTSISSVVSKYGDFRLWWMRLCPTGIKAEAVTRTVGSNGFGYGAEGQNKARAGFVLISLSICILPASFEVTVDSILIFSKLQSGRFPDHAAVSISVYIFSTTNLKINLRTSSETSLVLAHRCARPFVTAPSYYLPDY
ncbi:hypothetical protein AHF37_09162 [Paragonimus kellicotti]|nr:hypothetical protein AHF37_09162 [Paragonimus kellicotti]